MCSLQCPFPDVHLCLESPNDNETLNLEAEDKDTMGERTNRKSESEGKSWFRKTRNYQEIISRLPTVCGEIANRLPKLNWMSCKILQ